MSEVTPSDALLREHSVPGKNGWGGIITHLARKTEVPVNQQQHSTEVCYGWGTVERDSTHELPAQLYGEQAANHTPSTRAQGFTF